jgi:hypothetical protein
MTMRIVDFSVLEPSKAEGVAAGFCIEVVNLDDGSPQTGKWDGAVEAENANKAVADRDAMVYIGTYNSGRRRSVSRSTIGPRCSR